MRASKHVIREHSRHNSADATAHKRRAQVHRSQSSPTIDAVVAAQARMKSQNNSPVTTPTRTPTGSTSPCNSPSSSPFTSPSSPLVQPVALPPALPALISEPPPKLGFTDFSNQWRALTAQVAQGLSSCVHLAEFFQSVSEPNDSGFQLGMDTQPVLQAVEAILAEDRLERAKQRRTNALVVEQVAKPLLQFCTEARERLNTLVKEEQQLSKNAEATTIAVQSQKIDCLVIWDERKSVVEQFPSLKPSMEGRRSSGTKKRSLESAFRMFKQYEVSLKRANVDHHRFVRDMNRLLVSLEDLERSRIHALNTHSQLYSQLKQKPLTLTSPEDQLQEFLTTKFDAAERCPLRFVALPYDLPCTAEDLREGHLLSSPEMLNALSAEIATAVNAPETFLSNALAPLPLNSQPTLLNLPQLLGYPDHSARPKVDKPTLPRFEEKDIGLRRSRISRLLLNIEEPDLPKPKPEESDQEGSGYLELMTASSAWKTLYCSARNGKLLFCAKKDVGPSVKFPLRAARFIRYGRGEIPMRLQCFGVHFPHSGQRLVLACKTEQAVQDWLQTLTRVAVTERSVVGRSLISPLEGGGPLALGNPFTGEEPSLLERLDAIEKTLAPLRGYAMAELAEWVDSESDEEQEDASGTFSSQVDGKQSRLTPAVKEAYLKAELDGYLDRVLTGLMRHEPHALHWDLMAATPRKCLGVLKVFLSPPSVLVTLLRSVLPRHKSLDRLAKAVLNIATFTGTAAEVLDALIEEEVLKTPFDTQLFRTDSLSSKMMGFYAIAEGKCYLGKMLAKPVQAVILDASANDAPAIDFELDPAKISHVKSMHEHFKNKESVGDAKSLSLPSTPASTGPKAMSWWAKKLHDSKPPEEPTSSSRRTSFNTNNPPTPLPNNPSPSPPSPSPSIFRRVSVPKRATVDEKEDAVSLFAAVEDNPRRVSAATPAEPASSRSGSLEHIFFPKTRAESHAERKVPDTPSASPNGRGEKPKPSSVTSADNPTEFIKERKVAQNLAHLEQCCLYFLTEITKSLDYCPRGLRVIAHSVYRAVGLKFPSARLTAVGGFFFLRFLCPQMLQVAWATPEANATIAASAKRNLLLLTKVLQFLANCATEEPLSREQTQNALTAKEASMTPLADFVHAQGPRVSQFLHHLAEPPDPRFLKTLIEPTPQLLEEQGRELESDFEWFLANVLTPLPEEEEKGRAPPAS